MRTGSPKRPRRRRGSRADEPYTNFYASYYGLTETSEPPTRHRAAATHTGAALVAGLAALMRRKAVVFLTLGVAAIGVLAIGVMASATRTGSDPKHGLPSFVDRTSSPAGQGAVVAAGTSSPAARSSSAATSPAGSVRTSGGVPVNAAVPPVNAAVPPVNAAVPPVNAAPPPVGAPATSQLAQPTTGAAHSSHHSTPPSSTHHTTPPSTTHTSTTAPPPPTSTTPTPSPSKTCLVQDLLHPGHCLIWRP